LPAAAPVATGAAAGKDMGPGGGEK